MMEDFPEKDESQQTNIGGDVDTGGGAINSGRIDTGGGDHVGRDQIVYNYYGSDSDQQRGTDERHRGRRCDYYRNVPFPPHYVVRSELLGEICDALLGADQDMALTSSVLQADALFGMGGIGKTVMARALCDEQAVQDAFPDGILWATLGQTPELMATLREWIRALGGTVPQGVHRLEELSNILAENLAERRCLLIVDDVWERGHLARFMVDVPSCRLLFTTRIAEIATDVGATVQQIPLMSLEQAIELLIEWGGDSVAAASREVQQQIVDRLDRHPLAIRLAGVQILRDNPESWLNSFEPKKLRKRHPKHVHDSFAATFELSLTELSDEDRSLFIALSIFKDDEEIPLVAIVRLWSEQVGYMEEESVELLHFLSQRALLQVHKRSNTQGESLTVIFHDLIRECMLAELGEQGRQAAHVAILRAYRRCQDGRGWHRVPADGYFYDHLFYHLGEVAPRDPAEFEEAVGLFSDQNWLHVRVAASGYRYDGYLADLEAMVGIEQRVGQLHVAQTSHHKVAFCIRLALIRTTIRSLMGNYGPSLVGYAVEMGIWSVERAVSIYEQTSDAIQKVQIGTAILAANKLAFADRQQITEHCLQIARMISTKSKRLCLMISLTDHIDSQGCKALIHELIQLAEDLGSDWIHSRTLIALIKNHKELFEVVIGIQNEYRRAEILRELIPQLSGDAQVQASKVAWEAALNIQNEYRPAELLMRELILFLSNDEQALGSALETALGIQNEYGRANALKILIPQLSGDAQVQASKVAWEAALNIQDEYKRVEILRELIPQLSGDVQVQASKVALETALGIVDEYDRAWVLTELIPHLNGDVQVQANRAALETALSIVDEYERAKVLRELILFLSSEKQPSKAVFEAALGIEDEFNRAWVLMELMPQLSGDVQVQASRVVWEAALGIEDEFNRAWVLTELMPRLSSDAQVQASRAAWEATLSIEDEYRRAWVLTELIPHLNGDVRVQASRVAWEATLSIEDEYRRAWVLTELIPHLNGDVQVQASKEALEATLSIEDEYRRAWVLTELIPHLNGDVQALEVALEVILGIVDEYRRARFLRELIPRLSIDVQSLEVALEVILGIVDESDRAWVLTELIPHLNGDVQVQASKEALEATLGIVDEYRRARFLRELIPQLSGDVQALEAALEVILGIEDEYRRTWVLTELILHLNGDVQALEVALEAILGIEDEYRRAWVLTELIPHLNGDVQVQASKEALEATLGIVDEYRQAEVLRMLIPITLSANLLDETLVTYISNEWLQHEVIEKSMPCLDEIGKTAMTTILPDIPDYLNRKHASKLLNREPDKEYIEYRLRSSVAIPDEIYRLIFSLLMDQQVSYVNHSVVQIEDGQADLLDRILNRLIDVADPLRRCTVLINLLPILKSNGRSQVIDVIIDELENIDGEEEKINQSLLFVLATEPTECREIRENLLRDLIGLDDPSERADHLTLILPKLETLQQMVAVDIMLWELRELNEFLSAEERAQILVAILPYVQDVGQRAIYHRVMSTSSTIGESFARINILAKVAALGIDRQSFLEAKSLLARLMVPTEIAEAVAQLVVSCDGLERRGLLRKGLMAAYGIEDQVERAEVLVRYKPFVNNPEPILEEVRLAVRQVIWEKAQTASRGEFLEYLAFDPLVREAELPGETVEEIRRIVVEVCEEWEWL